MDYLTVEMLGLLADWSVGRRVTMKVVLWEMR
jgi:hypothetical protein